MSELDLTIEPVAGQPAPKQLDSPTGSEISAVRPGKNQPFDTVSITSTTPKHRPSQLSNVEGELTVVLSQVRSAARSIVCSKFAVVIGVSNYLPQTKSLNFRNVPQAINDAEDMAECLREHGFRVQLLLNRAATRDDMYKALNAMKAEAKQAFNSNPKSGSPVLLVYFAGYSAQQVGGDVYIVPTLTALVDMNSIYTQSISLRTIADLISEAGLPGATRFIVTDCCREVVATTDRKGRPNKLAPGESVNSKSPSSPGLCYASGTRNGEQASESPTQRNGIFTSQLLNTLRSDVSISMNHQSLLAKACVDVDNIMADVLQSQVNQAPEILDMIRDDFIFRPHPAIVQKCHELGGDVDAVVRYFSKHANELLPRLSDLEIIPVRQFVFSNVLNNDANHNLPQHNQFYVDRPDVTSNITQSLTQSPYLVICGLPGTGKSQLVKQFGHSCLESRNYHLIWRIGARHALNLDVGYDGLARLLEIDTNKLDLRGKIGAVHARLSSDGRLRDWLLIFDDAKNEADFFELIGSLPARHSSQYQGHVLITSRSPNWLQAPTHILNVFTDPEAMTFLKYMLPHENETSRQLLSNANGRHPLALRLAAGHIRHGGTTIQRYLRSARFNRIGTIFGDEYAKTLYKIVQIAVEELSTSCPFAVVLVDHLAVLSSAPIRDDVIGMLADDLGAVDYNNALRTCVDFGLVVSFVEQGKLVYQMHELTSEVRRAALSADQIEKVSLSWVEAFRQCFNMDSIPSSELKAEQLSLLPHVLHVLEGFSKIVVRDPSKTKPPNAVQDELVHAAICNIGEMCYRDLGNYDFALQLFELGLQLSQVNSIEVAILLNHIGFVQERKGNYDEAMSTHERALTILQEKGGAGHLVAAQSHFGLAWDFIRKGQYDTALEHGQRSLEIRQSLLEENHHNIAHSWNCIGIVMSEKGDYDKAIKYLDKAIGIRVTLRKNHLDTAISYNNIGVAYNKKGEYDKAIESHNKALTIRLAILGERHPDTACSYNAIGNVYRNMGEFDRAIESLKQALEIRTATFRDHHTDTAANYKNLGEVYFSKGEYDKALECHNQVLVIVLATVGDNHPDTAACFSDIANVHFGHGQEDKGIEFQSKALAIRTKILNAAEQQASNGSENRDSTLASDSDSEPMVSETISRLTETSEQIAFLSLSNRAPVTVFLQPIHTASVSLGDLTSSDIDYERNVHGRFELGRGAFAVVFKAKYKGNSIKKLNGQYVAVKELQSHIDTVPFAVDRSMNEAKLLMSLSHRNICTIYGAWSQHDESLGIRPAIVMEFFPIRLDEVLGNSQKYNFDFAKRLNVARQIAEVIWFLHSRRPQVLHCDLKPQSIMLTTNLVPKLCDFGEAEERMSTIELTLKQRNVVDAEVRGTSAYIAPEAYGGIFEFTDIFALGVITNEILSGNKPFPDVRDDADVQNRVFFW